MKSREAVLIMAHNNINILKKTMKLLDSEYFDLYIHIDKKSDIELQELCNVCLKSKVYLFKKIEIRWADYSQVECEIFLLEQAIKNKYTYYHLISGVDMPIKSAKEIFDFFENSNKKEFITFQGDTIEKNKLEWIKYYYFFGRISKNNKLIKVIEHMSIVIQKLIGINRIKKRKIKYMNGDNWFSITHELAKYIISKKSTLYDQYKYTKSPDEIFIQTIIYNSKFIKKLYKNNYNDNHEDCMRKIDWARGRPYIFKNSDFKELIDSDCMFARKFDEKIDEKIIDAIYEFISKKNNVNNSKKW